METRSPDPELRLEVDLMMLDYLLNAALNSVLDDRKSQQNASPVPKPLMTEEALDAVDRFLEIFEANHSDSNAPSEIHFRLQLLKFAILFCRRLTRNNSTPPLSSLSALRVENKARAQRWKASNFPSFYAYSFELSGNDPLPQGQLQRYRDHVLERLGSRQDMIDGSLFYGTEWSISLLDLITPFMELTAARARLNADFDITWRWMRMAGELMLQATLEQYLIRGAIGREAVEEAFAWGFTAPQPNSMDLDVSDELTRKDLEINKMFQVAVDDEDADVERTEIEGWQEIREEFCNLLQPDQFDLIEHLVNAAAEHPIERFETQVLAFLEALSLSLPVPVLNQLEEGQLEGLSREETAEFKRKVGVKW